MGGYNFKESRSRRSKKKRRGFQGTVGKKGEENLDDIDDVVMMDKEERLSASASKIDLSFYDNVDTNDVIIDYLNMYIFMDIKMFGIVELIGSCPECKSKISAGIDHSAKLGMAQKIVLSCLSDSCEWIHHTYSSFKAESSSRYDINLRSAVAFREIGRGHQHIQTFNLIMNMPPPFSHSNYDETVKELLPSYLLEKKNSMLAAAKNVKIKESNDGNDNQLNDHSVLFCSVNVDVDNDLEANKVYTNDCDVSIDGSWQRRGHASLNGFVSAIERVTDKVIDVDVMTKDCRSCKYWSGKEDTPGYNEWLAEHQCPINHTGSSGAMESEGTVRIFNRSVPTYNLRYINYIGDGDSSAYKKVIESNPYGDSSIPRKLECVGHIQKRVGAGLLKLVKENKGISGQGKGKLTKQVIITLQNYYGIAIRNNRDKSLPEMKSVIAAVILHCVEKEGVSNDERHKYCPKDDNTWCKYQKAVISGVEFKGNRLNISEDIYKLIRPLWLRLSSDELLEKCIHGRTQNVHEAFNAFVWKRAPKDIFIGHNILDLSVASAIVAFNDGSTGLLNIMKRAGLHLGHYNLLLSKINDLERIQGIENKSSLPTIKRRKLLHNIKKGHAVDKDYGAGMH